MGNCQYWTPACCNDNDQVYVDESNLTKPHARMSHMAVCLDNNIMLFGGCTERSDFRFMNNRVIWIYNTDCERWKKHVLPKGRKVPAATAIACAVVIGSDIYMFGGFSQTKRVTSKLWKLFSTTEHNFKWGKINFKDKIQTPSPRAAHAGWNYEQNLWIFAGFGKLSAPTGFLDDYGEFLQIRKYNRVCSISCNNQLLCYNPTNRQWRNMKCTGAVPSPRSRPAVCKLFESIWPFGGVSHDSRLLHDLYKLNMESLTWTQIQTNDPVIPIKRFSPSLHATTRDRIVLYGGIVDRNVPQCHSVFILDLNTHTWKLHGENNYNRLGHTGTFCHNNIFIFGGVINILQPMEVCNDIFSVNVVPKEPKSLLRLCLQTLFQHRAVLEPEWQYLPWTLHNRLKDMC